MERTCLCACARARELGRGAPCVEGLGLACRHPSESHRIAAAAEVTVLLPPLPPLPQEITPEKALEILRRISDDDCRILGFDPRYSRPDWMVLTVLPVPPPPVRPSVQMDASAR